MKVGDKVIYIQKSLPEIGLINNNIYSIYSTEDCGGCKDGLHIDVGIMQDSGIVYCPICNNIVNIDDRYLFHHSGFVPLSEIDEMELGNNIKEEVTI